MILIDNILLKKPEDFKNLDTKTSNYLFSKLDKGLCLFVVPDTFDHMEIDNIKKHKKNYKVGFLYDLLSLVYPNLEKMKKADIIAEKYHFWFSYRQFMTIWNSYEKHKKTYFSKTS